MAVPVRRRARSLLPEIADWFESMSAVPSAWVRTISPATHGIRIEDYTEEGRSVIRAEIPGVDPDKDIDITVDDNMLVIRARRAEKRQDKHHCEFHYGSFARTIPLPAGAREDDITASYADGILTVTVPLAESAQAGRHVPVQRAAEKSEKKVLTERRAETETPG